MLNLNDIIFRNSDLITADMGNEKVMMSIDSGNYYNLGNIGGVIWEIIEKPIPFKDIIKKLTEEYEITEKQCIIDTSEFIEALISNNLAYIQKK